MSEQQPTGVKLRLQMAVGKALFAIYKLKMRFGKKPESAQDPESAQGPESARADASPPVEPGSPDVAARTE